MHENISNDVINGKLYHAEHAYRGQAIIPSTLIPAWNVPTGRLFGQG
ncbi:MAG: hypothetical protein ACUVS4_06365 [Chloroflexaceae bacterium]